MDWILERVVSGAGMHKPAGMQSLRGWRALLVESTAHRQHRCFEEDASDLGLHNYIVRNLGSRTNIRSIVAMDTQVEDVTHVDYMGVHSIVA